MASTPAPLTSCPFKPVKPTPDQARKLEIARVGMMAKMPFLAHVFYGTMREVVSTDVPTAATDGRHLIVNPVYLTSLKDPEAITVFCHEAWHAVARHSQRALAHKRTGHIKNLPYDHEHVNKAMDWVVNADLHKAGLMLNPSWLYRTDVTGDELWEDVYERTYQGQPQGGQSGKPQGGQSGKPRPGTQGAPGAGQGQTPGSPPPGTFGATRDAPRGGKRDPVADAQGGAFDTVLEPPIDPVSGQEDLPDEAEFREAVAQAYAAAKAMGNAPDGALRRIVDELLTPQVDWRDHIRLLLTGRLGNHAEDWSRPNRRRLALAPIVILPGRRGYGCDTVAVGVDTSGSIGKRELLAFMSEVGGVLADCRPKRIIVIGCDAAVHKVEEVRSLEDVGVLAREGLGGGGGTDFRPVFQYLEDNNIRPETLVFLTDLMGRFPHEAPAYPVVWAATTAITAPFGEHVRIKI